MKVDIIILETVDSTHAMTVASADEETICFFNELGYEGNGYTWHAIVATLARLRFPDRVDAFSFSPEADSALVSSGDRSLIEALASELRMACQSEDEILRIIGMAGAESLE